MFVDKHSKFTNVNVNLRIKITIYVSHSRYLSLSFYGSVLSFDLQFSSRTEQRTLDYAQPI